MFLEANTFVLFSGCFITLGGSRGLIVDLNRHRCQLIPNSLGELFSDTNAVDVKELLTYLENEDVVTVKEYFEWLENEEWGIWTDSPENFPVLEKHFCTPQKIHNAIIDLVAKSSYNIERVIDQLDQLDCSFIQFRFFDPIDSEVIWSIVESTNGKNFLSIELYVNYKSICENYDTLVKKMLFHPKVSRMVIHSGLIDEITMHANKELITTTQQILDNSHCGIISPENFTLEKDFILEGLQFNTCLNKKIGVDINGNLKNCPTMKASFGHIDELNISEIISTPSFQKMWNISKNQVEICQVCEFRNVCSDCRAFLADENIFSKPKKCGYDPYTMEWS